jgi:hypothetical protein
MSPFGVPIDVASLVSSGAQILQMADDVITGNGFGGVGLAMAVSFGLVAHGLHRLYKLSQENGGQDATGVGGVLAELIIAGMLYKFGDTVSMVDASFGAGGIFTPATNVASGMTAAMIAAIHVGLTSLGTVSIFKGFLIMHKLSTGQQTQGDPFASSLWHIAGGSFCRAIAGLF